MGRQWPRPTAARRAGGHTACNPIQLLHDEQIVPRPRRVTELRRRLDLPAAAAAGAGAAGAGAPPSAAAAAAAAAEPRVYLASPGTANLLLTTNSPRRVITTR
eukprot:scaffold12856_cov47-Phaeocystis_antarctica.AAC.3